MRYLIIAFLGMLGLGSANAQVSFSIADLKCESNEGATLAVSMDNADNHVISFQCDIVIPAGVAVVDDITLTDRKRDHVSISKILDNGNVRFLAYSGTNKPYTGTSGEIFTAPLEISVPDGVYELKLINVFATLSDFTEVVCPDATATLTVGSPVVKILGDANGDGKVTMADTAIAIDVVLEKHVSNFVMANADLNGDGKISMADVAGIIDIVLEKR